MRKSYKLWILSVLGLMTVLTLAVTTAAWLNSNRSVEAQQVVMVSNTTPDLVIAKTKEELQAIDQPENYFNVTFNGSAVLSAATHDWAVGTETGLKFNSNPSAVSAVTGNQGGSGAAMLFWPVPVFNNGDSVRYYADYEVYIAAAYREISNRSLTAQMTLDVPAAENPEEAQNCKTNPALAWEKALSVDFYVDQIDEAHYKGTLNLADKGFAGDTPITVCNLFDETIPVITNKNTFSPVHVLMRFYFDGALQDDAETSNAYIRTSLPRKTYTPVKVIFAAVK